MHFDSWWLVWVLVGVLVYIALPVVLAIVYVSRIRAVLGGESPPKARDEPKTVDTGRKPTA
jgi:hypothetical protein